MGSSSTNVSPAISRKFIEAYFWKDDKYNINPVEVSVRSTDLRNVLGLVKHHFIVCQSGKLDGYRVAEWRSGGLHFYRAKEIDCKYCKNIGMYKLKDVFEIVKNVSFGKNYHWSSYNCNHWTQDVARCLGCEFSVNSFCRC